MVDELARRWWMLAVRGAVAVVFGILALIWPGLTILALIVLFGVYALVDGLFNLGAAIGGGGPTRGTGRFAGLSGASRGMLAVEGVLGVAFGVVALAWPGETAMVLLVLIALWAIVTGIVELVAAVGLRRHISGEIWLGIAGVLSVLFGLAVIARPGIGAVAVAWVIGLYAILFGLTVLVLALRLRRLRPGERSGAVRGGRPRHATG